MSIHLLSPTRLVAGFESGHVALYDYEGPPGGTTDSRIPHPAGKERGRWLTRWKIKVHNEAGSSLVSFLSLRSSELTRLPYSCSDGTGRLSQPRLRSLRLSRPSSRQVRSQRSSSRLSFSRASTLPETRVSVLLAVFLNIFSTSHSRDLQNQAAGERLYLHQPLRTRLRRRRLGRKVRLSSLLFPPRRALSTSS